MEEAEEVGDFLFGGCLFRVSAEMSNILAEVFHGFLMPSRRICFSIENNRFFPHPSQFIIPLPFVTTSPQLVIIPHHGHNTQAGVKYKRYYTHHIRSSFSKKAERDSAFKTLRFYYKSSTTIIVEGIKANSTIHPVSKVKVYGILIAHVGKLFLLR
jgi:hypothetical protein